LPGVQGFSSAWRERLASPPDGNAALIEQFRRLAATLHHAQQTNGLRSVMVTSASPGDGKTLTAVNLALVLTESYRSRVLLIDADLRRPSIHSVADIAEGSGLGEALRAPTEQRLALVPITSRLTLLPAGQPIANSIEALTSPRMRQILDEAATRFDWVILDAPPVGPSADARLLTQMVGGTLFVIHAGRTQCGDVQKSIESLGREQILGVILNGVAEKPLEGYYGYAPETKTS
jgi:capsular exopolysaccharide synthesis family protein